MSLRIIRTLADLPSLYGQTFVPTMGALHDGHLSLVRSGATYGSPVVMSIFVNPTQFGPGEDFDAYPRPLADDLARAEAAGVDAVFLPDTDQIYPATDSVPGPNLPPVATAPGLEDAHRPQFFTGVCAVVGRLLDLVRPARMMMGEKDFQQLRVVQSMVAADPDRWSQVEVIGCETVRDPDGLALSSRNAYLATADRAQALGLHRALTRAAESQEVAEAEDRMQRVLADHDLRVEYAVVRNSQDLMPVSGSVSGHRALIAAYLKSVRLIDNQPC